MCVFPPVFHASAAHKPKKGSQLRFRVVSCEGGTVIVAQVAHARRGNGVRLGLTLGRAAVLLRGGLGARAVLLWHFDFKVSPSIFKNW